ncbi:DUF1361 domain-containing protein [Calothrix sp. FACHB-1219]|uniref:DUF1361 domain-containing protein n=1 Tax=unclassified Calothrix TaxID=2619626 RepID=UPI001682A0C6|nr:MULTISPECIES: DUF1361 domain-containing protein [unclassified Calothrix]MBD2201460.1 DUF1361 domain-containing protein [Calothrix sp. FACHB-168]MBD2215892.1 DUF1361 domain-containing protein [Calothrix sp. FACHB-1219]
MKAELIELINRLFQVLHINMRWMTWNLFLAFIPLALSVWLFRKNRRRSWVWWLGLIVFYAFLPNAPYLLTDVIHLIDDIRTIQSIWVITLILIPLYLLVILAGFQAYVISLINLGHYLHLIGKSQWIFRIELITHILSAIGIYWGRFLRFNSWDFITQPDAVLTKGVEELLGKQPLVIIAITFIILTALHAIMKRVTLGWVRKPQPEAPINSQQAKNGS